MRTTSKGSVIGWPGLNTCCLRVVVTMLMLAPTGALPQRWQWPMAGHQAGDNIISQPDSYIGKEYNCCDLFLGGREGDAVVSPVDGEITIVGFEYYTDLEATLRLYVKEWDSWDDGIETICEQQNDYDPKYICGTLDIRMADGRTMNLVGLRGKYKYSAGQKVMAGDTLGTLAWSYKGIRKPSLRIVVSKSNLVIDDPMLPFGLESTFHLDIKEREDPLAADKIKEDITVFEEAVLDLYPSLNERMSDEAFHDSMEALRQQVTESYWQRSMEPLGRLLHIAHDSHIGRLPDRYSKKQRDYYLPVLYYMWVDDTLRVRGAGPGYEQYNGRAIASIDGMTGREYAMQAVKYIDLYDLDVQSAIAERLVTLSYYSILMNHKATAESKSHVVFADGEELDIPFAKYPFRFNREIGPDLKVMEWNAINYLPHPDSVYSTRQLNDSTAYLSLKTFQLNDSKLAEIIEWIGRCKLPNMVIDVRNNEGGDPEAMNSILACFAQQPMNRQRGGHLFVKKQKDFNLKYCNNIPRNTDLFSDYTHVEGKPGFYNFDTSILSTCIMPDSNHQYTGRVYVLTNGFSLSCATIFPSVLVRNRRAVSVGRETGSAYHFITAMHSAQIELPNMCRTISIPMEKVVFDTTVCARTPWGRGLLPDYELPLTFKEVTMGDDGKTDVMLEFALQLIAEGKYLSEKDPFAEIDTPGRDNNSWIWIALAEILVAAAILVWDRKGQPSKAKR